jgi:hypothetical protein
MVHMHLMYIQAKLFALTSLKTMMAQSETPGPGASWGVGCYHIAFAPTLVLKNCPVTI